MKKFIVLIAILIIFGGGYYFLSQSGEVIKVGIEKYGSEITGSTITLESAEVSLPGSSLTLKNLVVGNPNGFTTKNAFILGKTVLQLKMDENNPQNMHIEGIIIEAPEVTYDVVNGNSNLDVLIRNIAQYSRLKTASNADGNSSPLALVIDKLLIQRAKLEVTAMGNMGGKKIVLPEIQVQGIGTIDKTVSPAEAIIKTLTTLTGAIIEETTTQQKQPSTEVNTTKEAAASPISAN